MVWLVVVMIWRMDSSELAVVGDDAAFDHCWIQCLIEAYSLEWSSLLMVASSFYLCAACCCGLFLLFLFLWRQIFVGSIYGEAYFQFSEHQ